jgi:hypothetical protein
MSLWRHINGNRGLETAPTDDAATFAITLGDTIPAIPGYNVIAR